MGSRIGAALLDLAVLLLRLSLRCRIAMQIGAPCRFEAEDLLLNLELTSAAPETYNPGLPTL